MAARLMALLRSGFVPMSPQWCPLTSAHLTLGLREWGEETVLGSWRGWGWGWLAVWCGDALQLAPQWLATGMRVRKRRSVRGVSAARWLVSGLC